MPNKNARGFFQLVIDVEKERQRPHAKKSSSQEIILANVYGVTIFYTWRPEERVSKHAFWNVSRCFFSWLNELQMSRKSFRKNFLEKIVYFQCQKKL